MELKETLLMPKTNFEMRGNLANKEPVLVKEWKEEDLYGELLKSRKGNKEYSFHDGPPYANGNLHCGHLLNRVLKDFVIRSKIMEGYYVPFTFGWDTHGLPIENKVTKSGVNRKTTPIVDFRKICAEYAHKQVDIQKAQVERLGCVGDYDHPYLTLQKEFEASQISIFAKMALKGLIYKGVKPVYWSPSSESALAEAEIEYKDVQSYSIYVAFNIIDGKGVVPNDAKIIIWTTTPWTLPANLAVSLHPNFVYGLFDTDKGKFVFLKAFKDRLSEELAFTKCELIKEFKGKELDLAKAKHPFIDRESLIICGEHVTDDAGTGCVHTAPGHGVEDFVVGQKYHIPALCPVDSKGYMTSDASDPRLVGLFYEDANKVVLDILTENKALLKCTTFTHSYPHDWRTNKPLIFRATPQWFCSIEPIREQLLTNIHNVKWVPAWGEQRMVNMIKDRADWCISRQRAWGVPIPIFYCEDGSPIIEKRVFDHIEKLFSEHGSNIWYEKEAKELLPEGYKNIHSPNGEFSKEKDIMDVWFDSGSSFNAVMIGRGQQFPTDLYLEGSDQYRGWFNSSLIISTACYGVAPYKTVVSHNWVMDENWAKMSKSAGNGIDPNKIASVYGADILRLWGATVDYQQDVRLSESIIKQVAEVYRKVRNTFKFLLGNLTTGQDTYFDITKDKVDSFELVDTFILAELNRVIEVAKKSYDEFAFSNAMSEIITFMSTDLSSFYLDITKDILYCEGKDSLRRKQVQNVLFRCVDALMKLLTPVLPFTMEEVNKNIYGHKENHPNLYLFPEVDTSISSDILKDYAYFKKLRNDVLKGLEVARSSGLIGSAQEALITLHINDEDKNKVYSSLGKAELARLFIVSEVKLVDTKQDEIGEVSSYKVEKHNGERCDRCWNYVDELIEIDGVKVCPRCKKVING